MVYVILGGVLCSLIIISGLVYCAKKGKKDIGDDEGLLEKKPGDRAESALSDTPNPNSTSIQF
jgi:hypothetical protein